MRLAQDARHESGMARRFAKRRLRQNTQHGQSAFNHGAGQGGALRAREYFGHHSEPPGSSAPTKRVAQRTKGGQKRAGKIREGPTRSAKVGAGGSGNQAKIQGARGAQRPKKAEGEKQKSAEADLMPNPGDLAEAVRFELTEV